MARGAVRLVDPLRWEREDGVGEARMREIACGLGAGRGGKSLLVGGSMEWESGRGLGMLECSLG